MAKVLELVETKQRTLDNETSILIKTNTDGINLIQVDNSLLLEVKGRLKETFDMFLETDKKIKDIDKLITENQKEKERLQSELSKFTGKLKRIAFEN